MGKPRIVRRLDAMCLQQRLRTATPQQLNRAIAKRCCEAQIADLASQMKNRRQRPSSFVEIDLADRIATSGYYLALSVMEQAMELLNRQHGSFNIVTISRIKGEISAEILRQSLDAIPRHSSST